MRDYNRVNYIISETSYGYLDALKDLIKKVLSKFFNFSQRSQMDEYEEIYYDYKAEVKLLVKELDQAIKDNTEYLNDGEAWVKVQHIATELDELKGIV